MGRFKTVNRYQQLICEYKRRLERIRSEYGDQWRGHPECKKRTQRLRIKINQWQTQIKRMELRNQDIRRIAAAACEFVGIEGPYPLRFIERNPQKAVFTPSNLAKKLFYRYALESGISGTYLAMWTGAKSAKTPGANRMRFIRSFKENPSNREAWYKFKIFIETYTCDVALEQHLQAA